MEIHRKISYTIHIEYPKAYAVGRKMKNSRYFYLFCIILLCVLTGCTSIQEENLNPNTEEITATISPTATRVTMTPTPLPTSTQIPTPTSTPTTIPTATPFLYYPDGEVISKDNYDRLEKYETLGKGAIELITASADGERFIVQTTRGLYLYKVDTLEEIGFYADYSNCSLLPDGLRFAAVTPDLTIEIIELMSGEVERTIDIEAPVYIRKISFSKDSSLIAVAVVQKHKTRVDYLSNRIDVIDMHENKLLARLESDVIGNCSKIKISPDNSQLLSYCYPPAGGYPRIVNWNLSDQSMIWSLTNLGSFGDSPFSPDSTYLFTSTQAGTTIRWASNGEEIMSIRGGLSENSFSPDSRYFVETFNELVRVWDTTNFQVVARFSLGLNWAVMSFSDDGEYILANDGEKAWRTSDYELDESYSPDLITQPEVDMSRMRELGHLSEIYGVEQQADGTLLVWGYSTNELLWWWYPETSVYHEIALEGGTGEPTISPNNDQIAVCLTEGLTLIDLTSEEMDVVTPCRSGFTYLAFSGDAETIFMSYGTIINHIDVETGESLRHLRGHTYNVGKIKISDDGKYLFSISAGPTGSGYEAVAWGLDPYTIIQKWTIPAASGLQDAYFTADGEELIAINNEITIWRLSNLWYLTNISETTLALSPDGELAAIGKGDSGFVYYDTADWSLIDPESIGTDEITAGVSTESYLYDPYNSGTTLVKFQDMGQVLLSVVNDVIELWRIP